MTRAPWPCVCGHRLVQHEHYRAGMDCSVTRCTCRAYVAATPLRLQLARARATVARWRSRRRARSIREGHEHAAAPGQIGRW